MPSTLITGIEAAVGAGASAYVRPAVGTAYVIREVFSDPVFVGGVPDVQVLLITDVPQFPTIVIDPTIAVQKNRSKEIYVDNEHYLRLRNRAAGAANIGWTGHQVTAGIVKTGVFVAPNGGFVDIRPPAGEVWKVTEIGCQSQTGANQPDMTMYLTDGVLVASMIADGDRNLVWQKQWNLYISNTLYLRVEPIAAADRNAAFSMIRVPVEQFAAVVDLGAGANLDIQPADGQEAVVTQIGAETWAGVAPAGSTDIFVALTNGVILSDIMEDGATADSLIHNRQYEIEIDNAIYIRITEGSGANNEVSYCGYTRRYYNP